MRCWLASVVFHLISTIEEFWNVSSYVILEQECSSRVGERVLGQVKNHIVHDYKLLTFRDDHIKLRKLHSLLNICKVNISSEVELVYKFHKHPDHKERHKMDNCKRTNHCCVLLLHLLVSHDAQQYSDLSNNQDPISKNLVHFTALIYSDRLPFKFPDQLSSDKTWRADKADHDKNN